MFKCGGKNVKIIKDKAIKQKIKTGAILKLVLNALFSLNSKPSYRKQSPADIKNIVILNQSGDFPITPLYV